MRFLTLLVMLVVAPVLAAATPLIELPERLEGKAGTFIVLTAKTDAKKVKWVMMTEGLSVFPSDLLKDSKTTVLIAPKGTYKVLAYTAVDDEPSDPAVCTIIVSGGGPTPPPGPGPDPGPNPPPGPVDPFVVDLKAAFQADADLGKKDLLQGFAEMYKQVGETTIKDPKVTTWGALFQIMSQTVTAAKLNGKLVGVQKVIMNEIKKSLPISAASPLDETGRQLGAKVFVRISEALNEAGK